MRKTFRKALALLLVPAAALSLTGCTKHATKKTKKAESETASISLSEDHYALVLSQEESPYEDLIAQGFGEIMDKAGREYTVERPDNSLATSQQAIVTDLVKDHTSCIAIAPVDADALSDALRSAMEAGIDVCSVEKPADPECRELHISAVGTAESCETLMNAVLDISGGSGQWAILASSSTSSYMKEWVSSMRETMKAEAYGSLELTEVAYGDDLYQKDYDQTRSLLQNYPDLRVICALTPTGMQAAASAISDSESDVRLTGFGLPSDIADYVGDQNTVPYFYLWNPIDVGRLTAYCSIALHQNTITGELGESFVAEDMGTFSVTEAADEGTEVIAGRTFRYDSSNIAKWKEIL